MSLRPSVPSAAKTTTAAAAAAVAVAIGHAGYIHSTYTFGSLNGKRERKKEVPSDYYGDSLGGKRFITCLGNSGDEAHGCFNGLPARGGSRGRRVPR